MRDLIPTSFPMGGPDPNIGPELIGLFGPGIVVGPLDPAQREWGWKGKKCFKFTSEPLCAAPCCQPAFLCRQPASLLLSFSRKKQPFRVPMQGLKGDFLKNPIPLHCTVHDEVHEYWDGEWGAQPTLFGVGSAHPFSHFYSYVIIHLYDPILLSM